MSPPYCRTETAAADPIATSSVGQWLLTSSLVFWKAPRSSSVLNRCWLIKSWKSKVCKWFLCSLPPNILPPQRFLNSNPLALHLQKTHWPWHWTNTASQPSHHPIMKIYSCYPGHRSSLLLKRTSLFSKPSSISPSLPLTHSFLVALGPAFSKCGSWLGWSASVHIVQGHLC